MNSGDRTGGQTGLGQWSRCYQTNWALGCDSFAVGWRASWKLGAGRSGADLDFGGPYPVPPQVRAAYGSALVLQVPCCLASKAWVVSVRG